MGGASPVIYAALFRGAAARLDGVTTLDALALADALDGALQSVAARGGAKPGDKTLIDALAPAAAAYEAARLHPRDLRIALDAAVAAALAGANVTRGMHARIGRARTAGERALGHIHPGALSMALLLEAFGAGLKDRKTAQTDKGRGGLRLDPSKTLIRLA